jgi:hypothetical protein
VVHPLGALVDLDDLAGVDVDDVDRMAWSMKATFRLSGDQCGA